MNADSGAGHTKDEGAASSGGSVGARRAEQTKEFRAVASIRFLKRDIECVYSPLGKSGRLESARLALCNSVFNSYINHFKRVYTKYQSGSEGVDGEDHHVLQEYAQFKSSVLEATEATPEGDDEDAASLYVALNIFFGLVLLRIREIDNSDSPVVETVKDVLWVLVIPTEWTRERIKTFRRSLFVQKLSRSDQFNASFVIVRNAQVLLNSIRVDPYCEVRKDDSILFVNRDANLFRPGGKEKKEGQNLYISFGPEGFECLVFDDSYRLSYFSVDHDLARYHPGAQLGEFLKALFPPPTMELDDKRFWLKNSDDSGTEKSAEQFKEKIRKYRDERDRLKYIREICYKQMLEESRKVSLDSDVPVTPVRIRIPEIYFPEGRHLDHYISEMVLSPTYPFSDYSKAYISLVPSYVEETFEVSRSLFSNFYQKFCAILQMKIDQEIRSLAINGIVIKNILLDGSTFIENEYILRQIHMMAEARKVGVFVNGTESILVSPGKSYLHKFASFYAGCVRPNFSSLSKIDVDSARRRYHEFTYGIRTTLISEAVSPSESRPKFQDFDDPSDVIDGATLVRDVFTPLIIKGSLFDPDIVYRQKLHSLEKLGEAEVLFPDSIAQQIKERILGDPDKDQEGKEGNDKKQASVKLVVEIWKTDEALNFFDRHFITDKGMTKVQELPIIVNLSVQNRRKSNETGIGNFVFTLQFKMGTDGVLRFIDTDT